MEYTKLGNTDITISKICVGCMSFGKAGIMHDWTLDEAETETVVKHALDLGINFFDTANCYSAGTDVNAIQSVGSRAFGSSNLDSRHLSQQDRSGCNGQI